MPRLFISIYIVVNATAEIKPTCRPVQQMIILWKTRVRRPLGTLSDDDHSEAYYHHRYRQHQQLCRTRRAPLGHDSGLCLYLFIQ